MIARGAQWNPSAFRKEGLLPFEETVRAYIKKSIDLDNLFQNTKYVVLSMNTEDTTHTRSLLYTQVQRSKSMRALAELFDLAEYYDKVVAEQEARRLGAPTKANGGDDTKRDRDEEETAEKKQDEPVEKKLKTDDEVKK